MACGTIPGRAGVGVGGKWFGFEVAAGGGRAGGGGEGAEWRRKDGGVERARARAQDEAAMVEDEVDVKEEEEAGKAISPDEVRGAREGVGGV